MAPSTGARGPGRGEGGSQTSDDSEAVDEASCPRVNSEGVRSEGSRFRDCWVSLPFGCPICNVSINMVKRKDLAIATAKSMPRANRLTWPSMPKL